MTTLTDHQLRQVAAHIVLADARLSTDDLSCISDQLDAALADLGITLDGKIEDVDDATLEAVAEMIATATITVDWPDAPVRAFAAKLRAEYEKLRVANEQRGLYPVALAYTGAVASLDAALADLDSGDDA